jgi:hypothetical protein
LIGAKAARWLMEGDMIDKENDSDEDYPLRMVIG